ncbi:hypothetical protein R3I94_008685 [Phoxinus phoxinus]
MKKARRPVVNPTGTSDDIETSFGGSSQGNHENSAEKNLDDAKRKQKQAWSPTEIAAVQRHFRDHIARGKLATLKLNASSARMLSIQLWLLARSKTLGILSGIAA